MAQHLPVLSELSQLEVFADQNGHPVCISIDTNEDILTPKPFDYRALLGSPRLDQSRVQVGARGHRSTEATGTIRLDSSVHGYLLMVTP